MYNKTSGSAQGKYWIRAMCERTAADVWPQRHLRTLDINHTSISLWHLCVHSPYQSPSSPFRWLLFSVPHTFHSNHVHLLPASLPLTAFYLVFYLLLSALAMHQCFDILPHAVTVSHFFSYPSIPLLLSYPSLPPPRSHSHPLPPICCSPTRSRPGLFPLIRLSLTHRQQKKR